MAERFSRPRKFSRHCLLNDKINLQREGNSAKPYQVKQVRNVIVKYKLGGNTDV